MAVSRDFKIFLASLFAAWVVIEALLPYLPPSHRTARNKMLVARSAIVSIGFAVDQFKAGCGRYPTTDEGLAALMGRPPSIPAAQWPAGNIQYLNSPEFIVASNGLKVPADPWGRAFIYECPGVHNTNGYDLYSLGPTGKASDAAIDNWTPPR
jgi:general secretion pathway protein G